MMSLNRALFSNAFLSLGVVGLSGFFVLEMVGQHSVPLVPALSAFFIGCTAVLDRLDRNRS